MNNRIIASPDVLLGKPRIKGTRIGVDQILSCLAEGFTFDKIIEEFPDITEGDIRACIAYANNLVINVHVISTNPSGFRL